MLPSTVLLLALLLSSAAPTTGVVEGIVLRAADQSPVPGAKVVLRVKAGDQWLSAADTVADAQGKFRFEQLPADGRYLFQPGANRDGVHYPGPGLRLTSARPRAEVQLPVHDAIAFPNPLAVRRHTIVLSPKPDALEVSESLVIDNPSAACYVGQAAGPGGEPVTLRLSIPADFARVTFSKEFFGRRFALVDGKLVTGVPWPPGQRELAFSYVLPTAERHYLWQRCLDLPCSEIKVAVRTDNPSEVKANLNVAPVYEDGEIVFQSAGGTLASGHCLRVELGHLPIPIMAWARLASLGVLASLIAATMYRVMQDPARQPVNGGNRR